MQYINIENYFQILTIRLSRFLQLISDVNVWLFIAREYNLGIQVYGFVSLSQWEKNNLKPWRGGRDLLAARPKQHCPGKIRVKDRLNCSNTNISGEFQFRLDVAEDKTIEHVIKCSVDSTSAFFCVLFQVFKKS